jgi:Zn-dependent protease
MGYDIRTIILAAPVIIFSLTVHEFFHAWTANRLGDPTARHMGRMTLNPMAHLDLFGTLMLFLSGFRFGWAKPVPVNPYNLRRPRRDDFWVSAAGPLSNLGLARILAGANMIGHYEALDRIIFLSLMINTSLAFFNLLPLYPLDGSHIFRNILPEEYGPVLDQIYRVSPMVLILLIMSGFIFHVSIIWMILGPFVRGTVYLFAGIHL